MASRAPPDTGNFLDSDDNVHYSKSDYGPLEKRIGQKRTYIGVMVDEDIVFPDAPPGEKEEQNPDFHAV
jgi:hypothetical protein